MFIKAAHAADATGGATEALSSLLPPMLMVLAIMYFIGIRPQQRKQKEMRDMLASLRRGDTVVTSGGIVGRVSKVLNDNEVQVELAEGVRVRVLKSAVVEVRTRGEPVKDVEDASEGDAEANAAEGASASEGDGEGNVKPFHANTNKSSPRQPIQRSKGRRR